MGGDPLLPFSKPAYEKGTTLVTTSNVHVAHSPNATRMCYAVLHACSASTIHHHASHKHTQCDLHHPIDQSKFCCDILSTNLASQLG